MTTLLLVEGDTKAQIQATITRSDTGSAVDLNNTSSVVMRFRKEFSSTLIATLTGSQGSSGDFASGIVTFDFGSNLVGLAAGEYEGEIELTNSGDSNKETVFEVIKFIIREDFG